MSTDHTAEIRSPERMLHRGGHVARTCGRVAHVVGGVEQPGEFRRGHPLRDARVRRQEVGQRMRATHVAHPAPAMTPATDADSTPTTTTAPTATGATPTP